MQVLPGPATTDNLTSSNAPRSPNCRGEADKSFQEEKAVVDNLVDIVVAQFTSDPPMRAVSAGTPAVSRHLFSIVARLSQLLAACCQWSAHLSSV